MTELAVFGLMLACSLGAFGLVTWLTRRGQSGLALTTIALTGAALAILLFASGRPFGISQVYAMAAAMLVCLPAFLGTLAGALLGWLLRRRDDRL